MMSVEHTADHICAVYRLSQGGQLLTLALTSYNTLQVPSDFTQLPFKSLHLCQQSVMVLLLHTHAE